MNVAASTAFRWFGVNSTGDWSSSWLVSGLPYYLGATFLREDHGEDAFYEIMLDLSDEYFLEAEEYQRSLFWQRWDDPRVRNLIRRTLSAFRAG